MSFVLSPVIFAADAVHDDDRRIGLVDRRTAADQNTGSLPGWLLAVEVRPEPCLFRASPIELTERLLQIGAAHLRDGAGQRAARLVP